MHLKIAAAVVFIVLVLGGYFLYIGMSKRPFDEPAKPTPGPEASIPAIRQGSSMKGDTLNRTVSLYYIALDDNGKQGDLVGCGDSLIAQSTNEPLKSDGIEAIKQSLGMLFKNKSQHIGDAGLYNALYQSDLTYQKVEQNGEELKVYLTGNLTLGGICDSPRVQSQIEKTILDSSGAKKIEIFLNNSPLDKSFSQKGD